MPPGVGRRERKERRLGRESSAFYMYFINSQQADCSLVGWMDGYIQILGRESESSEEMPFGMGTGLERRICEKKLWRRIMARLHFFAPSFQKINKMLYHTD